MGGVAWSSHADVWAAVSASVKVSLGAKVGCQGLVEAPSRPKHQVNAQLRVGGAISMRLLPLLGFAFPSGVEQGRELLADDAMLLIPQPAEVGEVSQILQRHHFSNKSV